MPLSSSSYILSLWLNHHVPSSAKLLTYRLPSSFIAGVGGVRRPALGPSRMALHLQGGQLRPLPPRGEPRPRPQVLRSLRPAPLWHVAPGHGEKHPLDTVQSG